ncbi:MAG: sigma-70 family RNA polymerase sigma factor [Anaerolineales bacterium]|nr:sigma-70 family RNA polymerase sigma factor [Anaerolineales bacterium]
MVEMVLENMAERYTEDQQLIHRIAKGSDSALADLYTRFGSRLYAYALRILGNQVLAEDVLQDTLLTVWEKAHSYRGKGRVLAWLLRIVHNKCMRTFRTRETVPLEDINPGADPQAQPVEGKLIHSERSQLLQEGLQELSVEHRTVLELVFYHQMSLKETARICGIPEGTVKSRLKYAKDSLRGTLSRQGLSLEDL